MSTPGTPGTEAIKEGTPSPDLTKTQGPDKEAELRQKTAALAEERDRSRSLKEELEILKGASGREAHFAPQGNQYQQPETNQGLKQLDDLWESDPRRAMQAELQMAIRWYDQSTNQMDLQADEVGKKFADFGTYRSEVNRYVRALPIESRNRPGVIEAAYFYVKGQKSDDLVNLSKEELIRKIRMGEKVQGLDGAMPGGMPNKPDTSAPTVDQMRVAAAMGQKIEDYMKHVR